MAELVIAYERSLYGETTYAPADLAAEWESLDLERDALVLVEGGRIGAYGTLDDRGELWRSDGFVHPERRGRGLGGALASALESIAASRGARRIQNGVAEPDEAGHRLLADLGYRPVRVFRELRIELVAAPEPPPWPPGVEPGDFDAERDAVAFHAAQQEAFADHWEFRPRTLERWRELHIESGGFDPSLWRVVRSGGEIVAGTICEAGRYGGGWVAVLFTRRAARGQGVGRALLLDAFAKFRARGETSVGLSVDAQNATGAFHLYESAGMRPVLGWVMHEKAL
ncbi:MAG TPA: GNAT family N-acetyltransferase [Gaiellaceae bacterium]|nr:GNAT family N-acetyltransferase [Gaiellaceae bacterium]